jgi:hypothetical protein
MVSLVPHLQLNGGIVLKLRSLAGASSGITGPADIGAENGGTTEICLRKSLCKGSCAV